MWKQQIIFLTLVISILAWSSRLVGDAYYSRNHASTNLASQVAPVTGNSDVNHRSLSLQLADPKTIVPRLSTYSGSPLSETMTIYQVSKWSFFKTDLLQRYGSGRFHFVFRDVVRDVATCGGTCPNLEQQPPIQTPCLVVISIMECKGLDFRCNYPLCKVMFVGDEWCKDRRGDVRSYYSSSLKTPGYLPLGPRLDAWEAFQRQTQKSDFSMKSASKRRYAFNAIYSQNTNSKRAQLARLIEQQNGKSNMKTVINIAKKWTSDVNSVKSKQMSTDKYTEVLLDSVFTLNPIGHNPECYRLFEAVEAGSIPVMVKKDLYIRNKGVHKCIDALDRWYSAPMLVLDSWDDLFPTLTLLMEDSELLNEMQVQLRLWYDDLMRKTLWEFEDVVATPKIE